MKEMETENKKTVRLSKKKNKISKIWERSLQK